MRWQPPIYSPLPPSAFAAALGRRGHGARQELASWLRSGFAAESVVLTGSGTQALQAAIAVALDEIGGARTVALPAFTCPEVASAAVGAGARIALYDVEPATLAPEPDSAERALRAGATVLVAAPLYGMPVDWPFLETLTRRHGAGLIEDAAQAHGASWQGRRLGSLGRLSVISFGRGKGWTGGSGGALLIRESGRGRAPSQPSLAPAGRAAGAASLFRAAAQALLGRPSMYALPRALPFLRLGETEYHPPQPATGMAEGAAALVLATREASEAEAAARRANAAMLLAGLSDSGSASTIAVTAGGDPGYLRLPVRLPGGLGTLAEHRQAQRLGVTASYPYPLAWWPEVHRHLVEPDASYPGAEELARTLVTLPTHSLLHPSERVEILNMLRKT